MLNKTHLLALALSVASWAAPTSATVIVDGPDVIGSDIVIDGQPAGKITEPNQKLSVAPGHHQVRIVRRGYLPFQTEFGMTGDALSRLRIRLVPLDGAGANDMPADLGDTTATDIQLVETDWERTSIKLAPAGPARWKSSVLAVIPGRSIGPFVLQTPATPVIHSQHLTLIQAHLPGKLKLYSGQGLSLLVAPDDTIQEISVGRGTLADKSDVRTPKGNTLGSSTTAFVQEFSTHYKYPSSVGRTEYVWSTGILVRTSGGRGRAESVAVFAPKPRPPAPHPVYHRPVYARCNCG